MCVDIYITNLFWTAVKRNLEIVLKVIITITTGNI
jgi:hypothetical protein